MTTQHELETEIAVEKKKHEILQQLDNDITRWQTESETRITTLEEDLSKTKEQLKVSFPPSAVRGLPYALFFRHLVQHDGFTMSHRQSCHQECRIGRVGAGIV